jgi:general stress protein 26
MAQAGILQSHEVQKLRELVKDIRIAMLTTVRGPGAMSARPMAVTETEFDGDLYFLTKQNSKKVLEISKDDRVSVSMSDPRHDRYIVLSGKAELIADKITIRGLWQPAFKAWFPEGLDDPEILGLRVNVEEAEYWEGPGKVAQFFGIAKAVVTGQEFDGGEHAKISLTENATVR